jgi:hypothetical protein
MLLIKYLLLASAVGLFAGAAGILWWDVYRAIAGRNAGDASGGLTFAGVRWCVARKLAMAACVPLLVGSAITVVPGGMAGVLVSQISGVAPGALYPGVHLIVPFVQRIALFDVRDRVFTTAAAGNPTTRSEVLKVQTKEGLPLGLAISIRYRLDPRRLDYMHANLPQPVDRELVPPVVAAYSGRLCRTTWSATSFQPCGRKSAAVRPLPSPGNWPRTESL